MIRVSIIFGLLFLFSGLVCSAQDRSAEAGDGVLVTCADVLRLKPADADRALSARLEGVVTAMLGSDIANFVMQDGTSGLWVDVFSLERKGFAESGFIDNLRRLRTGDRVRVEGVTERGGFAPILLAKRLEILASGCDLPPAPVVTMSEIVSGKYDVQRVTLKGVVQELNVSGQSNKELHNLRLVATGGSVVLQVSRTAVPVESELLDTELSVSGTLISFHNSRAEMAGSALITNRVEDVKVLSPSLSPEKAPKISITSLRPYEFGGVSSHRKTIVGTVTYWQPGRRLILQEGNAAVEVTTESTQSISIGSVVEASGFVSSPQPLCRLENASLRVLRQGESLPPAQVTLPELLNASKRKHVTNWQRNVFDYFCRLVRIEGKLVEVIGSPDQKRRTLVLLSDGILVPVHCEAAPQSFGDDWLPGSVLAVEGVIFIEPTSRVIEDYEPTGNGDVTLLLRDASDVKVISEVSWWTRERLVKAAWAGLALIALVLLVIGELSRRIHRQASELVGSIGQQKEAEIRFLATIEERNRLGADMHDGLQQFLGGLSMQLEAARGALDLGRDAGPALHTARGLLVRLSEDFRHCLNALRDTQAEMDIPEILERTSTIIRTCHSVEIRVEVEGESIRLPGNIVANLMLVTQEAATNAVRHGKATLIIMRCHFSKDILTIEVVDNGIGFECSRTTAGHQYGLSSMRVRIERLGGSFKIESEPQKGTRVRVTLHLPVSQAFDYQCNLTD